MGAQEFCYWLQGWFELNGTIDHREGASPATLKMIEEHLQLVFTKVTRGPQPEQDIKWEVPLPSYSPTIPGKFEFDHLSRPTMIC